MAANDTPNDLLAKLAWDAPHAFAVLNADAELIEANATCLDWVGLSHSEVVGKRLGRLFSKPGQIYFETHILPQLRFEGAVNEIAVELVGRDGRVPVLLSAKLHMAGEEVLTSVTMLAVKERRLYERELLLERRRAEAALSELKIAQSRLLASSRLAAINVSTTSLAHELNQPLMVAAAQIAMAEHCSIAGGRDDAIVAAVRRAGAAVSSAGQIVKRLRRLTSSRSQYDQPTSPEQLIGAAMQISAHEGEIDRVQVDIAADAQAIRCDKEQVSYALAEVVRNAIEAVSGERDGHVRIVAQAAPSAIAVEVIDNGAGPPEADLFTIGFSTKSGRQGLGLANARTIIEAEGGSILIAAEPHGGCRVSMLLRDRFVEKELGTQ